MKKFVLAAILALSPFFLFAEPKDEAKSERRIFGFQLALGTGYTFYGNGDLASNMNKMMDRGWCRILAYADAGITLRLTDSLYFWAGAQAMADFAWKGGLYSNHASPAFFGGIQFYPGIGNLSFSLAYALGFRRDWDVLDYGWGNYQKVRAAKWGNGFRLAAEYDFKSGGGVVPGAGMCYLFMPTGNDDYDNTLAVYFRLAFR